MTKLVARHGLGVVWPSRRARPTGAGRSTCSRGGPTSSVGVRQTLEVGGPTGTVTFVFTDIEGSTALWERDEPAMRLALEQHDHILRSSMGEHGGIVFSSSGDGLAVAFDRAGDAVAAAVAAQAAVESAEWPVDSGVRVRIGIHTGEVQERDGD